MKITDLKPERVFYWFNEICRIPHGSGNTEKISEFCENFAKSRNLEYIRDGIGNIIIFKDGSEQYRDSSPVIIQGHLDMVCDKTAESIKDMTKEGVTPLTDGEYITADGTTLGADDGIAVAYILSVLEDNTLKHPPLEAVLTVDEEVGLTGASELDCTVLKGRRGINIDSEEEGYITVSCAGGVRAVAEIPVCFTDSDEAEMCFLKITAGGLLGGHSGIDIDKSRTNSIKLMGRILERISRISDINICSISGGAAMNIIPKSCEAVLAVRKDRMKEAADEIKKYTDILKKELENTEPDLTIDVSETAAARRYADNESTKKIIFAVMNAPDGVISMNSEISGMVESSLNTGTIETAENSFVMNYCVRSNSDMGKTMILEKLYSFFENIGGKINLFSDYPAWPYKSESPLRDTAVEAYRKMYGSAPQVISIHAGLECGILSAKLDNADFISFGPDMENVHTPNERLNVRSAERCYKYLISLLESLEQKKKTEG